MFVLKSICVESTWMKCPWNPLFLSENGTGCVLLQTLEWWASKTGIQKLEPQSSILSPSVPNVRDCLDFSLNNISDFYKSVHKVCHTVIDTFLTHLSKKNRDTGQWPEHTENTKRYTLNIRTEQRAVIVEQAISFTSELSGKQPGKTWVLQGTFHC